MKEEITQEDIVILVLGFYYRIPYYVLADDVDINSFFELLYEDGYWVKLYAASKANSIKDSVQASGINGIEAIFIRGMIALKPEYSAYRYVKLSDYDDDREAMTAYVNQFSDDTLCRLKRELAFFAGCQYKELKLSKPLKLK